ncbi:MAG: acetate--CoA ligase family protein [Chloroflexi bacterium]|nr:acetate--CoA ligase family protein [Chloroflexota bacterium]
METTSRPDFDLDAMFKPRSIALIGASGDPNKISGRTLHNLIRYGYPGRLYPINPRYDELAGLKCYRSLDDVPDEIDLAIIALQAAAVPAAVRECGARGVKAVSIFTSGFAEVGEEGRRLQEDLRQAALEGCVAVNGPNCAGLLSLPEKLSVKFGISLDVAPVIQGPVAIVGQSGYLGSCLHIMAQADGIGFNYWVSTGNEVVLGVPDYISYFLKQPGTKAVMTYVEQARDVEALKRCALEALEADKPLIAIKVGRSPSGAKAALSHTGSMVGSEGVYDAMFDQYGIMRARDLEDLFDFAAVSIGNRRPNGRGVALITGSGGAGILMCDRCEDVGIEVVDLAPETVDGLRRVLPSFAAPRNPVDLTAELLASPGLLKQAFDVVMRDPGVDSLVIFIGFHMALSTKLAHEIVEMAATTDKMVVVNAVVPSEESLAILRENGIPVFLDPSRGVRALGTLVKYTERRKRYLESKVAKEVAGARTDQSTWRRENAMHIIYTARQQGRGVLTEAESMAILEMFGIPTPGRQVAENPVAAVQCAQALGYPVVLKVVSADITHKSKAGGVRLGVKDDREVEQAFEEILASARAYDPSAKLEGVLVEETIGGGLEIIVGFKQEPGFGPVVVFGLGGVMVELLEEISMRLAPLDEQEALAMIRETKAFRLLEGRHGQKPRDIAALARVIMAVSSMAEELGDDLAALDINPVLVLPEDGGVKAVDALMILA